MRLPSFEGGLLTLLLASHVCVPSAVAIQGRRAPAALVYEEVSLARTGRVGDAATYAISRENLTLGRDGSVLSTIEVSGVLERTLLEEVEKGAWSESVVWREYRYGQGMGASDPSSMPVEGVDGLTYVVDPRDEALGWWDASPQAAVPGPAGALFSVLVLDAWSWDGVVDALRDHVDRPIRAGETFALDGWAESRDVGSESTGLAGRYRLGSVEVSVVGISACRAPEGCLRLHFRTDANEVHQTLPGMSISGREYFEGVADLSLASRALVSGQLWGPLVATFTMDGASAPIGAVLQRVRIDRMESTSGSRP